jgi:hypothetical protein
MLFYIGKVIMIISLLFNFFSSNKLSVGMCIIFIERKGQDGQYNAKKANPIQTQHHTVYNATHPNKEDSPCIVSYHERSRGETPSSRTASRPKEELSEPTLPQDDTTNAPPALKRLRVGE